jgi:SAM-dependent methyltransferase
MLTLNAIYYFCFRTLALARADISRLPFVSGSIDAVHAAAAIHCWPSPACAVAEISRVLRPGGVFVASTFVADILPPAVPVLRIGRPVILEPNYPRLMIRFKKLN